METYYGGRPECMIRRIPVPGVYVDFKSQYPTVYCLQQLQRYLLAKAVDWHYDDPDEIQALLNQITVDDVLSPDLWPTLDRLVLVLPTAIGSRHARATHNAAQAVAAKRIVR